VPVRFDIRKLLLTLAIVMGMILIAVPVCQMVSCGMSKGTAQGIRGAGAAIANECNLTLMGHGTSTGGVVPTGADALILTLGMLAMVLTLAIPPIGRVRVLATVGVFPDSHVPDPLGVRLVV
jgi:hypothetical protein